MTKIGACSNEKKHLEVEDEFCNVGMTPINAVSEKCELKTIKKVILFSKKEKQLLKKFLKLKFPKNLQQSAFK